MSITRVRTRAVARAKVKAMVKVMSITRVRSRAVARAKS